MSACFSNPRELRRAATESRFRVKCFARLLGLEVRTLERRFVHLFGCSPDQWLADQRMREAARLLQQGRNIKEVAAELAYRHSSSFCRQFRRCFGCTPAEAATVRTTVGSSTSGAGVPPAAASGTLAGQSQAGRPAPPPAVSFRLSQTANTLSQTANSNALRSADGI